MKVIGASFEGLRRASRAPGLVLAIWFASFAIAAPLAVLVLESIHSFTAHSAVSQALLEGFDTGWYVEFKDAGGPIEQTLSPGQVGVGAWLANIDRWWDGRVFLAEPVLLATGGVFILLWLVVLGGVLEALREGAPSPRLPTVLSDGLGFFPRLLRIALIGAAGYYLVFRFARWLFPRIQETTLDFTSERRVLLYNLAAALFVALLIVFVRMVSDYAKISVIVERRRSAALAVLRGFGFVVSNPVRVLGIGCFYGVVMIGLFLAYSVAAPGATDSTPVMIVFALLTGQVFLVAKIVLRVAFLGAETAFFEIHR